MLFTQHSKVKNAANDIPNENQNIFFISKLHSRIIYKKREHLPLHSCQQTQPHPLFFEIQSALSHGPSVMQKSETYPVLQLQSCFFRLLPYPKFDSGPVMICAAISPFY